MFAIAILAYPYYLEQEEIDAIENAAIENVGDTETVVMAEILRNALLDIAKRNHCSEEIINKINSAFENIFNSHFVREDRIVRLSKRSKSGITANVYRVLSKEVSEGWYIKFTDRKGNVRHLEDLGVGTVCRLGGLYAKAEWRGDTFVIIEDFGKVMISIPF